MGDDDLKSEGLSDVTEDIDQDRFVTGKTVSAESLENNYIIKIAFADWQRDPFIDSRSVVMQTKTGVTKKGQGRIRKRVRQKIPIPDFIYSGYLEMGKRRVAIVNGLEYLVGDSIDSAGYYLADIQPEKVVIMEKGRSEKRIVRMRCEDSIQWTKTDEIYR